LSGTRRRHRLAAPGDRGRRSRRLPGPRSGLAGPAGAARLPAGRHHRPLCGMLILLPLWARVLKQPKTLVPSNPSPLVGEGGPSGPDEGCRREICPEAAAQFPRTPHPSGFACHLLPQGEKGKRESNSSESSEILLRRAVVSLVAGESLAQAAG